MKELTAQADLTRTSPWLPNGQNEFPGHQLYARPPHDSGGAKLFGGGDNQRFTAINTSL